jgi:CIC family chloride channel protein
MNPVSLGGEFQGGVFAPALFIGATLGGAYGLIAAQLFPALNIQPPAFAMVGMAAVLAGVVHAPLTAIIMLFELTHDYRIILPLMFAVGVAFIVSRRLQSESMYIRSLAEKGIRLERGRDVEVLEGLTVNEVMQTDPSTLRETDSLAHATDTLNQNRHHGLPVMNGYGELVGILTLQDIDIARTGDEDKPLTVGDVCTRDLLTAYPDDSIGTALRRMSVRDIGRLPVVARNNPRRLIGVLRRSDLVRAYDVALTRRAAMRHRAHQARLDAYSSIHVEEFVIDAQAACAEKQVKDISWPRECVIASLRRGRRVIIPHGDTVLHAGDVLAVVADDDARAEVKALCSNTNP